LGDPARFRNKFARPKRLWDKDRIEQEKVLKREYGLKSMRELWITLGELKKYRREARRLLSLTEEEREEDTKKILSKLAKMGVLGGSSALEDVLGLTAKDLLERRLQTVVVRKGLARTMSQSRQLITHGFISLETRRVETPSYQVYKDEESSLSYAKKIDITVKEEAPVEESAEEKPAQQE
jgi:small subunit ribosomal protein S4